MLLRRCVPRLADCDCQRVALYCVLFILMGSFGDELNRPTSLLHYLFQQGRHSTSNRFGLVSCVEKVCGEFNSNSPNTSSRGVFDLDSNKEVLNHNDSLLCLYKFIAKENEKVILRFSNFDVKSLAPNCLNEYVDSYIEVTEDTIDNYVETNFLTRWCGRKKPDVLVSYYNVIVFAYHSDGVARGSSLSGTYEFVDSKPYNLGRKSPTKCEYELRSSKHKSGVILSPTYPGTYPNILNCNYKFIGQANERVSIHFEEILLHFGADHCPYDVLKVFDYQKQSNNSAAVSKPTAISIKKMSEMRSQQAESRYERVLIDSYCGRKLNFTLYSTLNQLEIEFDMYDSLGNEEYTDDENKIMLRKGFKAYFTFSQDYADLNFITGTHVLGTNCDQVITSAQSTGMIYSPTFFQSNTINASCKYIFEGLNDNYNFEIIKLNFHLIELQKSTAKDVCEEDKVSHFVVYGSDANKSKYCFNQLTSEPKEIRSSDSHMTLVFNSHSPLAYTPSNFKASFQFFTEFGIEGTRVYPNRTCLYTFNSNSRTSGTLNSPRYPNNYPLNLRCIYLFELATNERLLFTYKEFRLPGQSQKCKTSEDHLDIYQSNEEIEERDVSPLNAYKSKKRYNLEWQLSYIHCGTSVPVPFITDENTRKVKFSFDSDNTNSFHGFNIHYSYLVIPECKSSIFTQENVTSGQIVIGDELSSHYCEWFLKTDQEKSFLISFRNQNIDETRVGKFVIRIFDLNENTYEAERNVDRGAQMRLSRQAKFEYSVQKANRYFQIDSSYIKIELVAEKASSDLMDFGTLKIIWTTARKNKTCDDDEFWCQKSNYCIKSVNVCNGIEDCPNDFSDETDKCLVKVKPNLNLQTTMKNAFFVISAVVVIVFLSICLFCRLKTSRKKKKSKSNGKFTGPPIYTYSTVNSLDYLGNRLEAAITSV